MKRVLAANAANLVSARLRLIDLEDLIFDRFGFLTLDGEMPTNGVQPLWMAVQILLVKLLPALHEAELLAKTSWLLYLLFSLLMIRLAMGDRRSVQG